MNETLLLTLAASLVATLFGLLVAVLGWLGSRIYGKLDELSRTMQNIAGDLHERINGVDKRVTVIEARCDMEYHPHRRRDDGD